MLEQIRQTFTLGSKIFARKSILSANIFVSLKAIYVLSVRVETFAKQSVAAKYYPHI